ncbi:hypothetical protein [Kalamiella sp. sgz302252]|uniref:hypothetical protein n=1 Tax=Pantoea sp. sgz302252 TaxID=3341827 RepID=UPI0036D3F967
MPFNLFGTSTSASRHSRQPDTKVMLPGKPGLEGTHHGRVITVSESQQQILKKANRSIEDTWKALDKGSANQIHDVIHTHGGAVKRTVACRAEDTSAESRPWRAARFRAGNCGEMAAVNGLLLASSGISEPVAVCSALDGDHAFVMVGDRRINGERIYSDAWPLYGRADKEQNYDLSKRYRIVKEYAPQAANPEVREQLLHGDKASREEVNRIYQREMRRQGEPIDSRDLGSLKHIARRHGGGLYQQYQASKNINVYYQTESGGNDTELKPEMKRSVYESRRRRQDDATREAVAELMRNVNRGV